MSRSFNGTSDQIVGTLPSTSTGPLTLAMWANLTSAANPPQSGLSLGDNASSGYGIELVEVAGGGGSAGTWGVINFGVLRRSSTMTMSTGTWYHLIVTLTTPSGGATTYTFYQNGAQTTQLSATAATSVVGHLNVGSDNGGSFANAIIDDTAIWTVVLTAGEALALGTGAARPNQIRPASLVHWFSLGLGSPEPDLSGNKNNGTVTGTAIGTSNPPYSPITPRWPTAVLPVGSTSSVSYRRTLSPMGTRADSRQVQGWSP